MKNNLGSLLNACMWIQHPLLWSFSLFFLSSSCHTKCHGFVFCYLHHEHGSMAQKKVEQRLSLLLKQQGRGMVRLSGNRTTIVWALLVFLKTRKIEDGRTKETLAQMSSTVGVVLSWYVAMTRTELDTLTRQTRTHLSSCFVRQYFTIHSKCWNAEWSKWPLFWRHFRSIPFFKRLYFLSYSPHTRDKINLT